MAYLGFPFAAFLTICRFLVEVIYVGVALRKTAHDDALDALMAMCFVEPIAAFAAVVVIQDYLKESLKECKWFYVPFRWGLVVGHTTPCVILMVTFMDPVHSTFLMCNIIVSCVCACLMTVGNDPMSSRG